MGYRLQGITPTRAQLAKALAAAFNKFSFYGITGCRILLISINDLLGFFCTLRHKSMGPEYSGPIDYTGLNN
jgi:hypothetical protein